MQAGEPGEPLWRALVLGSDARNRESERLEVQDAPRPPPTRSPRGHQDLVRGELRPLWLRLGAPAALPAPVPRLLGLLLVLQAPLSWGTRGLASRDPRASLGSRGTEGLRPELGLCAQETTPRTVRFLAPDGCS